MRIQEPEITYELRERIPCYVLSYQRSSDKYLVRRTFLSKDGILLAVSRVFPHLYLIMKEKLDNLP